MSMMSHCLWMGELRRSHCALADLLRFCCHMFNLIGAGVVVSVMAYVTCDRGGADMTGLRSLVRRGLAVARLISVVNWCVVSTPVPLRLLVLLMLLIGARYGSCRQCAIEGREGEGA